MTTTIKAATSVAEAALAAMAPCQQCGLTVPHAFEDPHGHSWDPHHMTVDPADVLRLVTERDLAVAHDRQPYPTAWAYEQACRVRDEARAALSGLIADLGLFAGLMEAEWYNGNCDAKAYERLNADLGGIVAKHRQPELPL